MFRPRLLANVPLRIVQQVNGQKKPDTQTYGHMVRILPTKENQWVVDQSHIRERQDRRHWIFITHRRRPWTNWTSSETCPTVCWIADSVVRWCRTMNTLLHWRTSSFIKLATAPTVRVKKGDVSARSNRYRKIIQGWKGQVERRRRPTDYELLITSIMNGTGKEKWNSEKGHNWNERGGKSDKDAHRGGKIFWQECNDKKGGREQEKDGKRGSRMWLTCGSARQIAFWSRKDGHKHLH